MFAQQQSRCLLMCLVALESGRCSRAAVFVADEAEAWPRRYACDISRDAFLVWSTVNLPSLHRRPACRPRSLLVATRSLVPCTPGKSVLSILQTTPEVSHLLVFCVGLRNAKCEMRTGQDFGATWIRPAAESEVIDFGKVGIGEMLDAGTFSHGAMRRCRARGSRSTRARSLRGWRQTHTECEMRYAQTSSSDDPPPPKKNNNIFSSCGYGRPEKARIAKCGIRRPIDLSWIEKCGTRDAEY